MAKSTKQNVRSTNVLIRLHIRTVLSEPFAAVVTKSLKWSEREAFEKTPKTHKLVLVFAGRTNDIAVFLPCACSIMIYAARERKMDSLCESVKAPVKLRIWAG